VEGDTIVAVSTAAGPAALAVVRLSGPESLDILRAVAPGLAAPPRAREALLTQITDPATGLQIDQAVVTVFRGPASYTGEDVAEITGHGGWMAPSMVLEACVSAGARRAEAGEFTRRAYLNGKLDLIQAEAVLDLVEGRSRPLHAAALHALEGGLSERVSKLRERLVHLEVLLAHHLDFPEEDDAPVPLEHILREALDVQGGLAHLLSTAPEGELLREGALAVLAGRPNSGKSSLFNALIGDERAIVTEIPGTTRDALEAVVSLGGFPFRLVDTAGLRDSTGRVEQLGIEVARRYVERADVLLLCVEGEPGEGEGRFIEEAKGRPVVLLRTKVDLQGAGREQGVERTGAAATIRVSVRTGEGLAEIRRELPDLVFRGLVHAQADTPVLTRARQAAEVGLALREVTAFRDALSDGVPAELAATHLRPAESALEALLGVISREEVLDALFREFCIGK
jgi:tRNA modification GTPase